MAEACFSNGGWGCGRLEGRAAASNGRLLHRLRKPTMVRHRAPPASHQGQILTSPLQSPFPPGPLRDSRPPLTARSNHSCNFALPSALPHMESMRRRSLARQTGLLRHSGGAVLRATRQLPPLSRRPDSLARPSYFDRPLSCSPRVDLFSDPRNRARSRTCNPLLNVLPFS